MEKDGSVRAIGRGLAVLKVINLHGSLNMMTIARLSAMPYPTACRIVDTLIDEGMIEREPSRKFYRPTSLVMSLSHGYRPEDGLAAAAKNPIRDLTRRILWPVSVCSRVGATMMIRECSHRQSPKTLNMYYPGYTIPILGCSAGTAYLAFCGADEREAVLKSLAPSPDTAGPGAGASFVGAPFGGKNFERMLENVRQSGFASFERCHNNANPGKTSSLSAPILVDGACEGTVTIVFFSSALTTPEAIRDLAGPLCETGALIAQALAAAARAAAGSA